VWSVYALLTDEAPPIDTAWLMQECTDVFGLRGCTIRQYLLPFTRWPSVDLRWGDWLARLTYEKSEAVLADARTIRELVRDELPDGASAAAIGRCDRRIRVVFGDDPGRDYTNHMIEILGLLEDIPGALLFDAERKAWWV